MKTSLKYFIAGILVLFSLNSNAQIHTNYPGGGGGVPPVAVSQDITCTSIGACTVTQIQDTAVSIPTGTGNVVLSNGPTLTGPIYFASGRTGTFVCTSGGSITVANTNILATSNVIISTSVPGGTVSTTPNIKTLTASTSFVVLCATLDTSTYNYAILN